MKNQLILISFGVQHSDENRHMKTYKPAHLTCKPLLHYLGKYRKLSFNNI